MNKILVILTEYYPYAAGEFFLDDELKIISDKFEKVIVLTNKVENNSYQHFIPSNLRIVQYNSSFSAFRKLFSVFSIPLKLMFSEYRILQRKYHLHFSFKWAKIISIEFLQSSGLINVIQELIKEENLLINETVFYSYWHDHKAFALARLRHRNPEIKSIARAHGWDVFADRHSFPYLPFKSFQLENLNRTFSISQAGVAELLSKTDKSFTNKVSVSRLGKSNSYFPLLEKKGAEIMFCSCSNLISLKRIHLIIDVLSELKFDSMKWFHFGIGPLSEELMKYAEKKLPAGVFNFMGFKPNHEILQFYNKNYIDFFLNFSESEGVPVSIMEAFSAAIPVVATDVGGNREIVNQLNGFLIEKDFAISETVQLIEQFFRLSQEKQIEYRKNAYHTWQTKYNAEVNYSEFAEFLLSL